MSQQLTTVDVPRRTLRARWKRARSLTRRGLVAALTGVLVFGGLLLAPSSATAATNGVGYFEPIGNLGSYSVGDGQNVYCLQPGELAPYGSTSFAGYQQWGTMTADENARVNYAISEYGQTNDRRIAAAVAMYVWSVADPVTYNSHGMSGDVYYVYRAPESDHPAILGTLNQIRAEAASITASPTGAGSGQLTFQVDDFNNYAGTLTVQSLSPAGATGTLVLTNGIFLATGTNTLSGATLGSQYDIQGIPPADDGAGYKISVNGTFSVSSGYGGNLAVYTTPGQQALGGPGQPATTVFSLFAEDPTDRSVSFQPVVTTAVANKFIEFGQPFDDNVTFSTAANASGVNNPWYQSATTGQYISVVANAVIYGPFSSQPIESDTVPVDAPVAGTATVTTSATDGPTVTYPVESSDVSLEAGFYTWVWTIDAADQSPITDLFIEDDYLFVDRFGQVAETHISPSQIQFVTDLDLGVTTLGGQVDDTITPGLSGGAWLRVGGERVPVTLTGNAWWTPQQPVVSSTPSADAELLGTYSATLTGPTAVIAPDIEVGYRAGWVTLQWCIVEANQPAQFQGMVSEWCDQFGVPAETVQVLAPSFSTTAQTDAIPGGTVRDTLVVDGTLPDRDMEVTFSAYLQPEDATAPVCDVTNVVLTSSTPTIVDQPTIPGATGYWPSEDFPVDETMLGTLFWVETVTLDGVVIHVGECGAPTEITEVAYPTIVTQAVSSAKVGEPVFDTAVVSGAVLSGAYMTFSTYRQAAGYETAVCDASTIAYDGSGVQIPVPEAGSYESERVAFDQPGAYYWQATLYAADGAVLAQEDCGMPLELTTISLPPPPLALTGASPLVNVGFIAALVALLLGTALIVVRATISRRRSA